MNVKKWIGILITCMVVSISFGQKAVMKEGAVTLKDSRTSYTYVLDHTHKYISAFNGKGIFLWTSFTTDCSQDFMGDGPKEINHMEFMREKDICWGRGSDKYVLYISFCHCWGYLYPETGRYQFLGCD